jgi:hypothetical protein
VSVKAAEGDRGSSSASWTTYYGIDVNIPWLLATIIAAALPLPSPSPRRDSNADIPVAKMPRIMVPFPATAKESVTKTASFGAEKDIPLADADADLMTALQPNANATPGVWRADQLNLLQILRDMDWYASTVARGPGQTTSLCLALVGCIR